MPKLKILTQYLKKWIKDMKNTAKKKLSTCPIRTNDAVQNN
jgi:hypothetical protein